jgi:hypothetical protein
MKLPVAMIAFCFMNVICGSRDVLSQNVTPQRVALHLSNNGEPLAKARVQLRDTLRGTTYNGITDQFGSVSLLVPVPREYRVQVTVAGFTPWIEMLTLGGSVDAIEVRVILRPFVVTAIDATADNRCKAVEDGLLQKGLIGASRWARRILGSPAPPELKKARPDMLVRVHGQAMAGLRKVVDGSKGSIYDVETIAERPYYDDSSRVVMKLDTTRARQTPAIGSPDPNHLLTYGLVEPRKSENEWPQYHVPTPELLVSSEFAESHCFSAVEIPDSARIGLAFEPAPGSAMPDVRGVIWVDTVNQRLSRIDYYFTGLTAFLREHEWNYVRKKGEASAVFRLAKEKERVCATERVLRSYHTYSPPEPKDDHYGGSIHFGLSSGAEWTVTEWKVTWPAMQTAARYMGSRTVPPRHVERQFVINLSVDLLPHTTSSRVLRVEKVIH